MNQSQQIPNSSQGIRIGRTKQSVQSDNDSSFNLAQDHPFIDNPRFQTISNQLLNVLNKNDKSYSPDQQELESEMTTIISTELPKLSKKLVRYLMISFINHYNATKGLANYERSLFDMGRKMALDLQNDTSISGKQLTQSLNFKSFTIQNFINLAKIRIATTCLKLDFKQTVKLDFYKGFFDIKNSVIANKALTKELSDSFHTMHSTFNTLNSRLEELKHQYFSSIVSSQPDSLSFKGDPNRQTSPSDLSYQLQSIEDGYRKEKNFFKKITIQIDQEIIDQTIHQLTNSDHDSLLEICEFLNIIPPTLDTNKQDWIKNHLTLSNIKNFVKEKQRLRNNY